MLRAAKWWMPVAAMTLLSLLSYVDRTILAQLSPTILREEGLSAEQYGWIIDAFSVAYLVGSPVWGHVVDRFGLRLGLAVAVALWTVASASHAFASTAATFAIARAALGFGEGATFPAGLRTATQTLRPDQRARGLAIAYGGGSLGAVLTPIVATPIALRWGWRGTFVCTGFFGMAWLALWALVSRDSRLKGPPRLERPTDPPRLTRSLGVGLHGRVRVRRASARLRPLRRADLPWPAPGVGPGDPRARPLAAAPRLGGGLLLLGLDPRSARRPGARTAATSSGASSRSSPPSRCRWR